MKQQSGFTLIEVIVVITLLGLAIAMTSQVLNYGDVAARNNANKMIADLADIEVSFGNYYADKNAYPTGLADATFVPTYLFVPQVPTRWDNTYGVSGYKLAQQSAQPSPNNGYYVCAKTTVTGSSDMNWAVIGHIAERLSSNNFFYNTACPATSNMGAPGGAATVFLTYWLTRS